MTPRVKILNPMVQLSLLKSAKNKTNSDPIDKEIRILKVEANVLYNELVNSSAFQGTRNTTRNIFTNTNTIQNLSDSHANCK